MLDLQTLLQYWIVGCCIREGLTHTRFSAEALPHAVPRTMEGEFVRRDAGYCGH
jgi:hypothetical protein